MYPVTALILLFAASPATTDALRCSLAPAPLNASPIVCLIAVIAAVQLRMLLLPLLIKDSAAGDCPQPATAAAQRLPRAAAHCLQLLPATGPPPPKRRRTKAIVGEGQRHCRHCLRGLSSEATRRAVAAARELKGLRRGLKWSCGHTERAATAPSGGPGCAALAARLGSV